jgi:hypothetical protein
LLVGEIKYTGCSASIQSGMASLTEPDSILRWVFPGFAVECAGAD